MLQQVLNKNPENVKVVFKNFPLSIHKMARKAAAASLAAERQGKFWEYHDNLFENTASLSDAKLQQIAEELGLDIDQLNRDMNDPAIQQKITADIRNGQQSEVRGTPTAYVNGKRVTNRSLQGFQQMIDDDLQKAEKELAEKGSAMEGGGKAESP